MWTTKAFGSFLGFLAGFCAWWPGILALIAASDAVITLHPHGSKPTVLVEQEAHKSSKKRNKRQLRNRMVYNNWGLYDFMQMLKYKCLRFGKELHIINERDTTRMCHVCHGKKDMPLWQRTYRCENCGLVMDRDENSAVNIYERFLARLGPHMSVS